MGNNENKAEKTSNLAILSNPKIKKHLIDFLVAVIISVLFLMPYISRDLLSLEHDTLFHVSRIEGMAQALKRGELFPGIYPLKNIEFGYASPLFYCDILLIPFGFLYNCEVPLAVVYKLLIFAVTLFSVYAVMKLTRQVTDSFLASSFTATAFCFANYRISDVYIRGALGELMAMGFLALCISALYTLLEEKNPKGGIKLCVGVCGLIFSHNLTFALGMVMIIIICCFYIKELTRPIVISILKAMVCAFFLTSWFTIPMIEQLRSQDFVLSFYTDTFELEKYSLPLWKYFANKTVFGLGNNDIDVSKQMLVNIGYAIPLCSFAFPVISFAQKKKIKKFHLATLILGLICFILPWDGFPWASMSFLRMLQFPWRLMSLALVLLIIPTSLTVSYVARKTIIVPAIAITLVLIEGIVHLEPAYKRTTGITSETTYAQILSGELFDPFCNQPYMYAELSGADYLPVTSPDFTNYSKELRNGYGNTLDIKYVKDYDTILFNADSLPKNGTVVLPITYYKGYACYVNEKPVEVKASKNSLVQIVLPEAGNVIVKYEGTTCRKICIVLSLVSFAICCAGFIAEKLRCQTSEPENFE